MLNKIKAAFAAFFISLAIFFAPVIGVVLAVIVSIGSVIAVGVFVYYLLTAADDDPNDNNKDGS